MFTTKYYGKEKKGTTVLEIYNIQGDNNERIVHRQLRDQEAYDTWHLSYYFKEILQYKKLLNHRNIKLNDIPRKDKNILLYLIFACNPAFSTIVEIGSTLFEGIDGLEIVKLYRDSTGSPLPDVMVREIRYIGVEISELLAESSKVLHPGYNIETVSHISEIPLETFEVVYDRSVMNYMCDTPADVAAILNRSEVVLTNCFFSKDKTFCSSRLGKSLTYFSLKEVIDTIEKPLFHLFGERAPGPASGEDLSLGFPVIEGFFLYAEDALAQEFLKLAQTDSLVAEYFGENNITLTDARELVS